MTDTYSDSETLIDVSIKLDKPKKWHVILHNDNATPMDFVIMVLMQNFNKSYVEANKIMLLVHNSGRGIAGTYSYEIASQKASDTMLLAQSYGYPLQTSIEENDSDE